MRFRMAETKRTVTVKQPEGQKGMTLADLREALLVDADGFAPTSKVTVRINFGGTIKSVEVSDD